MGAKFWLSALAIIVVLTFALNTLHKAVTAQPKAHCNSTCVLVQQWRALQNRGIGFNWHGHPPCRYHGGVVNVEQESPLTRWLYATYVVTCGDGSVLNEVPATDYEPSPGG